MEIGPFGRSLPSQKQWSMKETLVTDVHYFLDMSIEILVLLRKGHPLDGMAIEDTVLILRFRCGGPICIDGINLHKERPKAIVNCDVCPLTLPAASLLDVLCTFQHESNIGSKYWRLCFS